MYFLGGIFLVRDILNWLMIDITMLLMLCILASVALISKVEGTTSRSHCTFSFIVYGFAFVHLGVPGAAIVI
jgi:hypothetical protein